MNLSLSGKTALIGGASAGIGRAVALQLAELGAQVVLMARTAAKLQAVMKSMHGDGHQYLVVDFEQPEVLQQKIGALLSEHTVHILINNTGGPPGGPIVRASTADFLHAYNNHLLCSHMLAQACMPGMQADGYGRIINIISTSVKEPLDNLGVSNSTRWAVAGWAKTWANEVGPLGITVNNVLPGYTKTGRLDEIVQKRSQSTNLPAEAVAEQMKQHVPMRRFATPEEIAYAVAFLASPAAGYINGINLPVDGGRTKSL
jgi:3-oxoacyl-[acyl-carrier protein] reductase